MRTREAVVRFVTYVLLLTPFTQGVQMTYYIFVLHLSDGQLLLALEAAVPLSFVISLITLPVVTAVVRWQDRRWPAGREGGVYVQGAEVGLPTSRPTPLADPPQPL